MTHLADVGEIKERAEAVNLTLKRVAKAGGADPASVYRAARGEGSNTGTTLRKLNDSLCAEEVRIARHLLNLPHVQDALRAKDAA